MNTEKYKGNPLDSDRLENRIHALKEQIHERTLIKVRKRRWVLFIGFGVVVLCSAMLARLTAQARELDADALTQIGRMEIQKHLPDTREVLQAHLASQAPQLVKESYQALLGAMPNLRTYLMKDLNSRIDRLNNAFEEKLSDQMAARVRLSKANIDRKYPGAGDREKLEYFVEEMSESFNENFNVAVNALYQQYTNELRKTTNYIAGLNRSTAEELTEEERIKKEIIETMVQIMQRERTEDR